MKFKKQGMSTFALSPSHIADLPPHSPPPPLGGRMQGLAPNVQPKPPEIALSFILDKALVKKIVVRCTRWSTKLRS